MKKLSLLIVISVLAAGLTLSGCNAVNDMFGKLFGKGGGPITESGSLSGPNASYTITVNAGNVKYVEVPFTYPQGQVDFWVRVAGQDGNIIGDFDLDNGEIIQLSGGGTFYLTIYSRYGAGDWSATYDLTAGGTPPPGGGVPYPGGGVTPPAGGGAGGNCNFVGTSGSGYLNGPGDSCSFSFSSGPSTRVVFDYPKGSVDFWVELVGTDGYTVIGDFDLDNGEVIIMPGAGTYYMTIYSNGGAGNWSCYLE